jgi:hypothetical protein
MRTDYILPTLLVFTAVLASACGGGLWGSGADVPCPASIEAPVLSPGDTWTYRFADNRRWRQMYDAVSEDGLLRGRGPEPRATYYFDQAHTLRKVYIDGTWLTFDTPDFPEIGKPELEFPLTVGKRWRSTWNRHSSDQILQDSRVAGCEQLTVTAGTFVAVRIVVSRRPAFSTSAAVEYYTVWYAPAVKYWVKGEGGSATMDDPIVDFELESFTIDTGKPATN